MLAAVVVGVLAAPAPTEPASPERASSRSEGSDPRVEPVRSPAYEPNLPVLPEEDQDIEKARTLWASANAAIRAGRFEEAIELLAEAYRYQARPNLLYALAVTHGRAHAQDPSRREQRMMAILRYRQYLAAEPDGPYAEEARFALVPLMAESVSVFDDDEQTKVTRVMLTTDIEGAEMSVDGGRPRPAPGVMDVDPGAHRVLVRADGYAPFEKSGSVPEGQTMQVDAELAELDGQLRIQGSKGATVYVDGKLAGKLPLNPISVSPGSHTLSITKPGHLGFSREITIERAGRASVDADLRTSGQRVTSFGLFALGGIGLITGGVFLGIAIDAQDRARALESRRRDGTISTDQYDEYERLIGRRDSARTTSIAAAAVGGVLVIAGGVLFAFDGAKASSSKRRRRFAWQGAPVLGPRQIGFHARLRF